MCVVFIDTRWYVNLNMGKDNKDKPFKIKIYPPNNAAKRPCPDTLASTATDTTYNDNFQELSSVLRTTEHSGDENK